METETEFEWHVCTDCQQSILRDDLPRTCRGCAARLKGPREQVDSCFFCRDHSMPFATVTSITNYEGIIRDLVVRMKSNNGQVTAIQMGRWLAACLTDNFFESNVKQCDYVTPMPSQVSARVHHCFADMPRFLKENDPFRGLICSAKRICGVIRWRHAHV